MKLAIVASLIAGAAAFAPQQASKTTSVLNAGFESEIGVTEPLGFYDPLNLLANADEARFKRLRFVELK
jgi:hypothetical protein